MKLNRKTVFGVLLAALFVASTNASALTLGKMRGSALLGKELDLTVSVEYAADEDIAPNCFDADVRFGDIAVEGSRLSVKVVSGPQPQTKTVHITTSSRVADAVVTVNLRTSCGPKASRRYVMLADVLSESDSALPGGALASASGQSSKKADSASAVVKPTGDIAAAPVVAKPTGITSSAAAMKAPASSPAKKGATANPVAEHAVAAKAASQANALILEDLQHRVDGIEKWQAQSTAAEDLLKSQERNQILETGLTGLKVVTAKNQQNLQQVAAALEGMESENYGRSLVYALGALLAVCAVAVGYVLKRSRSSGSDASPWWLGGEGRAEARPLRADISESAASAATSASQSKAGSLKLPEAVQSKAMAATESKPAAPAVDVDFEIDFAAAPAADAVPATPAASASALKEESPDKATATPVNAVQNRVINTKEMLDVRQQAEFFMALGQHDDAVRLLEESIQNSSEANPLVYLDLLKIFHTLSRREDFERYRAEFNQYFTGRVPPYADFLSEGNGLDAYEEICQQIVVLWPTEYTVDFIEQCLVRTPEDDPEQGIDLEAFKDLLLLYGILKRLSQPADSSMVPFSTSRLSSSQVAVLEPKHTDAEHIDIEAAAVPLPTISGTVDEPVVDLDLDIGGEGVPDKEPEPGNLIDFDMSGFVKPEPNKPEQK